MPLVPAAARGGWAAGRGARRVLVRAGAHVLRPPRLQGRHAAQVRVRGGAEVGVGAVQVGVRVVAHHVLLAPHERRRADLRGARPASAPSSVSPCSCHTHSYAQMLLSHARARTTS